MDPKSLVDGLILYLGLVALLTFHEFGHAWMAWKCGDDTARSQGRVSLNPLIHMDLVGTVVLPLLMVFLGNFLVGWAKPVPVNPNNLRNGRVDDVLVTLAGPWMNLLLAFLIMCVAKVGLATGSPSLVEVAIKTAHLSLLLCFFNLLPIPPLDGSQVVRAIAGFSYETYFRMARYGIFVLILFLQIPFVRDALEGVTNKSLHIIGYWVGLPV